MSALCLFILSEGALKVATFESAAVLVLSRPMKYSMLLMFIHIWTKQVYVYMVLILKSLKWYPGFLLLVESSIAVLTWANLPVRSTQILPKEKVKKLAHKGQKGAVLHAASFGNCISLKSQVLEIFWVLQFQGEYSVCALRMSFAGGENTYIKMLKAGCSTGMSEILNFTQFYIFPLRDFYLLLFWLKWYLIHQ